MQNLEPSLSSASNLDESFSNFGLKDLFTKKAISAALLTGTPVGAFYEAKNQDAIKAQNEARDLALAAGHAQNMLANVQANANVTVGEAENKISEYNQATSTLKTQQAKLSSTKNIILWSIVSAGVLAMGVTAYFIFIKKSN